MWGEENMERTKTKGKTMSMRGKRLWDRTCAQRKGWDYKGLTFFFKLFLIFYNECILLKNGGWGLTSTE